MSSSTPVDRGARLIGRDAAIRTLGMLREQGLVGPGMTPAQRDNASRIMAYNMQQAENLIMSGGNRKDVKITLNIPGSDVSQANGDAVSGATDLEKMRKEMSQNYGFTMQASKGMMPVYSTNQQLLASGSLLGLGGAVSG